MLSFLVAYGANAVVMLSPELLGLGVAAKAFYRDGIGHRMADSAPLAAGAAGCWALGRRE